MKVLIGLQNNIAFQKY